MRASKAHRIQKEVNEWLKVHRFDFKYSIEMDGKFIIQRLEGTKGKFWDGKRLDVFDSHYNKLINDFLSTHLMNKEWK